MKILGWVWQSFPDKPYVSTHFSETEPTMVEAWEKAIRDGSITRPAPVVAASIGQIEPTKPAERKPVFWDAPDRENLRFTDEDEAINVLLEETDGPLPLTITVCGYARMEPDFASIDVLTDLLDGLDQDYGGPETDPTEATETMREAEKAFLAIIQKEYEPWMCEEVCRKEIVVDDWIARTAPAI